MLSFFVSLPFILALAFVCAMVGIALILEQGKKNLRNKLGMELATIEHSSKTLLQGIASSVNNGAMHNLAEADGTVLADLFTRRLYDVFGPNLSILHQECNIPETAGEVPRCSTVHGLKTSSGEFILIYGSPTPQRFTHKDNRPNYYLPNSNEDVGDYVTKEGHIDLYYSMRIAAPNNIADDHPNIQTLHLLIQECTVDRIHYAEEVSQSTMQFYSLEKDRHGEYSLKIQRRSLREIPKQLLNLSYNKVNIDYNGEGLEIPMGEAINLIQTTLESKENVFIFGISGSGKSYLADEISRRAARRGNTAVIFISPAMVQELQKVELLPDLLDELNRLKDLDGLSPLFVIDEAESLLTKTVDGIHSVTNSFMLSMLDGQIQKLFDCSCLLTFNCDREMLNEKVFRAGRSGLEVRLNQLPKDQTAPLVTYLKDANPTLVFDTHRWEALQKAPEVTLAEAYSCFIPPSKQRVLTQIIRAMKGEPAPADTPPASPAKFRAPASSPKAEPAPPSTTLPPLVPQPSTLKPHNKHGGRNKHRNRGHGADQASHPHR